MKIKNSDLPSPWPQRAGAMSSLTKLPVKWKYTPRAWWPELPGKGIEANEWAGLRKDISIIRQANARFEMLTGSQPRVEAKPKWEAKFMCLVCKRKQVFPPAKFCAKCAKDNKLASTRRSKMAAKQAGNRLKKKSFDYCPLA
jgi:hypothetical protein